MLETISTNHYRLHGHLDMQDSSVVLQELMGLPRQLKIAGQDVLLDISALESTDSLLLAALLDLQRKMMQGGGRLRVEGFPEEMRGLAGVYGIETLLDNMLVISP